MFVAMSMIPAGDTAGKLLSWGLGAHPIYVSWSRFFIGALMVLPFHSKRNLGAFEGHSGLGARALDGNRA